MLSTHKSNYIAIIILLLITFIRPFFPIHPAIMTAISTCLLVYVGCTFSTKICSISGEKEKEGIETMKQKDAWIFPVIGSGVLLGLYFLFKFFNEKYLNILLHIYFTLIGSFSIGQLFEEKIIEKEPFKTYNEKKCINYSKNSLFCTRRSQNNQTKYYYFFLGITHWHHLFPQKKLDF